MTLWQRLQNLWRISALDPKDVEKPVYTVNQQPATVVDMYDPLSIDLGEE